MRGLAALALLWPMAGAAQGLSPAEARDFVRQIAPCWNLSALAKNAQARVVTLRFVLDRRARPVPNSFTLVGAGKGTAQTTKDAYTVARRAVLRCGREGFDLPLEKYQDWKTIEMTFNPERMPVQ